MRTQKEIKIRQSKSGEYIPVKTKTGSEVHAANFNGSTTHCGVWLKVSTVRMYVDFPVTCERCLKQLEN